jgi:hypothetical protein
MNLFHNRTALETLTVLVINFSVEVLIPDVFELFEMVINNINNQNFEVLVLRCGFHAVLMVHGSPHQNTVDTTREYQNPKKTVYVVFT